MKVMNISKALTFFCIFIVFSTSSQSKNYVLGEARAKIVNDKLNIEPKSELNFGKIDSVQGSGSVVISADCKRSTLGQITTSDIDAYDCASFAINGIQGQNYNIILPSTLSFSRKEGNIAGKLNNLTVNNFSGRSRNAGYLGQGIKPSSQLDNKGSDDVYIGGSLIVPANAAPGTYIGEVPVTVSY
ncbi:MAG: hypothetical protein COV35_04220 [Alphaproteobacteria bacterium CG11_big_fil_rev_8_21_14_0_20_39_49]|nr:MAG: hypothetical protein COV35_04220 [Alphaproteobacteria bacterium CG11_big_fil_rev_8_21_14_0_20_39_49]